MASRWIERTRQWSRARFTAATVAVALLCILLLILDGISAAVHFHAGVAIFGALFFVVLFIWFRVVEARTGHFRR